MVGGLLASVLSLGLQGLDALALPLTQIWRPDVWASGLATSYGRTALIAAVALLAGPRRHAGDDAARWWACARPARSPASASRWPLSGHAARPRRSC